MKNLQILRRLSPLVLLAALSACSTSTRHLAVVVDASFAQAVFAVDDAETAACAAKILSADQCAAANPRIKQALTDVAAVSAAIKASPKSLTLPTNLPNLLTDLTAIQAIVGPSAPAAPDLAAKITAALNQAILVIRQFTTGG